MYNKLSVPEAAKILEIGNDQLMAWLRSKNPPPFGAYIKQEGKRQGRYLIFKSRLLAYITADDYKIST